VLIHGKIILSLTIECNKLVSSGQGFFMLISSCRKTAVKARKFWYEILFSERCKQILLYLLTETFNTGNLKPVQVIKAAWTGVLAKILPYFRANAYTLLTRACGPRIINAKEGANELSNV
jgi:hypothetical protein